VKSVSGSLGREQLAICGKQIASDHMPADAARRRYSEVYTGDQEYIKTITENLRQLIAEIGLDRFDQTKLNSHRRRAAELLGKEGDPFTALWQNGLLGYSEGRGSEKRAIFYSESEMTDFTLPPNKKEYVLHSGLIDAVGIKAVGKNPVIQ
jgi:hypothetical protein